MSIAQVPCRCNAGLPGLYILLITHTSTIENWPLALPHGAAMFRLLQHRPTLPDCSHYLPLIVPGRIFQDQHQDQLANRHHNDKYAGLTDDAYDSSLTY